MNKTKEEIIHSMCLTYRHDYGLDRDPNDPTWIAGMTPEERMGLYRTMEKIYEHNIEPIIDHYNKLDTGESVVVPKDVEHAEAMIRVGEFYLRNENGKE